MRLQARRFSALWHDSNFLKLWVGQTISLFGSRVTYLALPLTAVVMLHATAFEMGVLEAVGTAPALLIALPVGVWVDRVRRRPVMIAANVGQAALLSLIPAAAWLGVLRLPQVYLVAFLAATLATLFSVAYRSYLPSLVRREQLIEANSRLAMSGSLAQIAGPGLGGVLVQLLTAPAAIAADALSFAVAALSLSLIRRPEPAPAHVDERDVRREAMEGLHAVLRNRSLRSLAGASATFNLFDSVLLAVYVLYMSRTLQLSAAAIGLVFGLAGVGGLLAALLAAPITARIGLGRAIVWGILLATAGELLIATAGGPQPVATLVLIAAEGFVELGATLYGVNAGSLRQAISPERLRGRVAATNDLLGSGMGPVGALLGGVLGATVGLRGAVIVAGIGTLLSTVWLMRSPVPQLHEVPAVP